MKLAIAGLLLGRDSRSSIIARADCGLKWLAALVAEPCVSQPGALDLPKKHRPADDLDRNAAGERAVAAGE